jgi:hypothetical protein
MGPVLQKMNEIVPYSLDQKFLKVISKALRDYNRTSTLGQFENDYNCKIEYDAMGGIIGVSLLNSSAKTALLLKYEL